MVALLLFLVCAAVGAVILTAGAATAGRMSEKSKMDQRYYSVSSAAELLAKQLCDKPVTIERVRTTETVTDLSFDGTTVTTGASNTTTTYSTFVNGTAFNGLTDTLSFLSARAVKLLYGQNLSLQTGFNTEQAMQYTFSNAEDSDAGSTLSIKHSDEYSSLNVENIKWSMKANGTIELTIGAGEDNNNYTIVLTLVPEIDESAKTLEEPPVTALDSSGQFKKTAITTTTKTSIIKWKVGGISKEVSKPNEQTSGNG